MAHEPTTRSPVTVGQAAFASASFPLQLHGWGQWQCLLAHGGKEGGCSVCLRTAWGRGRWQRVLSCGGGGSACLHIAQGRGSSNVCFHTRER
eukprot:12011544-Alexandrium_andersonii.AAC.1